MKLFPSLATIAIVLTPATALAIPTINWEGAQIPDWTRVTFDSLPATTHNGQFQSNAEINNQAGYNMSRSWAVGDTPPEFLKLGDFTTSFKLQNLSHKAITEITGIESTMSLENFGVIKKQSIDTLITAIPSLKDLPINSIPPIHSLLTQQVGTIFDPSQTLSEFLSGYPLAGQHKLEKINLSSYTISDIPGADETPIGSFENWENALIEEIPNLSNVPFSEFPGSISGTGTEVGTADLILKNVEGKRNRTISGSDREGFTVPCEKDCAHVELNGSEKLAGRQWISGQFQEVQGGFGALATANSGVEPTGIHPFGEAFKIVLWQVNEKENSISTMMFFRVCDRGTPDLGCTPYFIGGVPFLNFEEKMPMFLGKVEDLKNSPVDTSSPSSGNPTLETSSPSSGFNNSPFTNPTESCSIINSDAMFNALSTLEGQYDSIGQWTCDGKGNCGRGLGAGQYMSYRPDVRAVVSGKPNGIDFLSKLDQGKSVTGDELLLFFSPNDQRQLFENDITQLNAIAAKQIDPTTGIPFKGDRLIERVAQMHFGGINIPIDSSATDANGKLSVEQYGKKVNASYQSQVNCP